MCNLAVIFCFSLYFVGSSPLIVPNELPTLLSLIYSNIPTVKKGTDSRLGWGFRLGDRADFQVLVELGPQKYTQPLANQPSGAAGPAKRDVPNTFGNELYAQRQLEKNHISDSEGGKWLKEWSDSLLVRQRPPQISGARPGLGVGEIDAKSVIPDDSKDESRTTTTTTESLDDVDIDE